MTSHRRGRLDAEETGGLVDEFGTKLSRMVDEVKAAIAGSEQQGREPRGQGGPPSPLVPDDPTGIPPASN